MALIGKKVNRQIKKPLWKRWWVWVIAALLVIIIAASGEEEKPAADVGEQEAGQEAEEIKSSLINIINERDYSNTILDKITINAVNADSPDEYYKAAIYFDFDKEDAHRAAEQTMRMYSDNLVAIFANEGISKIKEATISWNDNYNDRTVKYVYGYRNGRRQNRFFVIDVVAGS